MTTLGPHRFVRVHCDACGKDALVAFSCKGRGFCPSCDGTKDDPGIPVLYLEPGLAALANTWRGGWANGHYVTHADAVAELREMGYEAPAMRTGEALKIQINLDPAPSPPVVALARPAPDSPLSHSFWQNPAVRSKTWAFRSHNFKFPNSHHRRRSAIRDAELRWICDERALAVLGTVLA